MSRVSTKDIIDDIARSRRFPEGAVSSIIGDFLETITTNLRIGNSVNLKNIGTMTPKLRFVERSPKEPISIKFTISSVLKKKLNH